LNPQILYALNCFSWNPIKSSKRKAVGIVTNVIILELALTFESKTWFPAQILDGKEGTIRKV